MSGPAKIVKTKLFIGNLDSETHADELTELFSPFGPVLEASVIKDYGFVHFGSVEEAEKAAAALNNKELHGKRLRVELSTSTVRHRPGQPEPASALRHPRARAATRGHSNGASRYNPSASSGGGGGGPMRHNPSAWIRHDARPYDSMPMDHGVYDRARPYDVRSESRPYYEHRHDSAYSSAYDPPGYGSSRSGGPPAEPRHYRDLPDHGRPDVYGSGRPYERHLGPSPVDPYYAGGLPPRGPPPVDPYQGYDPYQKYYPNRSRDPEYPDQRDYDPYPSYRTDPYGAPNGHGSLRHELPANLQPGVYAPSHRQHQSYPSGSSNPAHYYGAQQR